MGEPVDMPRVLGLPRSALVDLMLQAGEQTYRAGQVFSWVHGRGIVDPGSMTDLPRQLRGRLGELVDLREPEVVEVLDGGDQTLKLVTRLDDGWRIESVLIPRDREHEGSTTTLCVSTQVGCSVRCGFCRSGRDGLSRNLATHEIVGQVHSARSRGALVDRIVFMGIGEPLDNYAAVASAMGILSDGMGMGLGPGRMVVSTVGRVEGIRKLGEDFQGRVGLALSLHSVDPGIRSRLLGPRAPDPGRALEAVRAYPLPSRERLTVEIVLVGGVNDTREEASRTARALRGLRCRVNLIPLNPFPGLDMTMPASRDVQRYQEELTRHGLTAFVRQRRGDRILAACGQLALGRE